MIPYENPNRLVDFTSRGSTKQAIRVMQNDFYYRFEQHFRGSREEIKHRQSVYLPILEPLKTIQSPSLTLDLGCGRGEWLELMAENGFSAQGVDLDDAMLQFCAEQGFAVRKADALDCLRSVPDATMSVVSGFHIAEHLPFETLRSLIVEALRALIPGGILILETPNPENLVVGSCNFYTDPTHRAPLPPHLLAYLGEDAGFKRIKVLRLNQPPQEWYSNSAEFPSLSRVIFGVGPDYAIVAQKDAAPETLTAFSWFAEPEDGSNSLGGRINEFDAELLAIQQETQRAQSEQMARLDELSSYQRRTEEEIARLTALWEGAQRAQSEQMARLDAVMNSRSWRITAPLRKTIYVLRNVRSMIRTRLKRILIKLALVISRRPALKSLALTLLEPFPKVKDRLRHIIGAADASDANLHQGSGHTRGAEIDAKPDTLIRLQVDRSYFSNGRPINNEILCSDNNRPGNVLVIRGDLNSYSGYAKAIGLYARLLEPHFTHIIGVDLHYHVNRYANVWPYLVSDDRGVTQITKAENTRVTVLTISTPDNFASFPNARNIGLFFWETNRLDNPSWLTSINQMDEIWIPVEFMRSMLNNEGVIVPVKYFPCPLSAIESQLANGLAVTSHDIIFRELSLSANSPQITRTIADLRKRFNRIYFSSNSLIARKGFPVLAYEWFNVLKSFPDAALIIKVSTIDALETADHLLRRVESLFADVGTQFNASCSNVYVCGMPLPETTMRDLAYACDATISLSFGEGLGLGIFESLLAGKAVICPRHTSFAEFLPDNYPYFLETLIANYGLSDSTDSYPISAHWGVPVEGSLLKSIEVFEEDLSNDRIASIIDAAITYFRLKSTPPDFHARASQC